MTALTPPHPPLIRWSPQQLYEVVADVTHYHEFVPWCQRSVVTHHKAHYMEAELEVGFRVFVERYTSKITLVPNKAVHSKVCWWWCWRGWCWWCWFPVVLLWLVVVIPWHTRIYAPTYIPVLPTPVLHTPVFTRSSTPPPSPSRPPHNTPQVADSTLFEYLDCHWEFAPGPTPASCWLTFRIDFAFRSPLYRHAATMFFEEVCTVG